MENLHNTSPSLPTTDCLVQLTEDRGDQLHALWSIYTVRLEVFIWKSGKIVLFYKTTARSRFSAGPGSFSVSNRQRAMRLTGRRRCDRRDVDQSALEDEQVAGAQLATGPCALFNNARKQRSASETAAWSSCRAVILGIVEMQRRWSAHTSASGWPCIGGWAVDDGRSDLAPSRCGRRIVVMLWSPSVHLPAAVTDCHDPLDMDGSIICLLISSTGVLDSYIARLVSCVSMEADKSSALIDEKLAANFYTTLTASAIQLVTALGKG
ncbi:hypothetical protein T07_1499 [Trichinella nelsoni]|uniref:Uncharacterized protein n=1 Tax=Trichinella nelsoni TaxID=6336 RepID=A0A0V0RK79_9BILA|nr:hypothetical protein T07_1499 [Trichinella nelsoni]